MILILGFKSKLIILNHNWNEIKFFKKLIIWRFEVGIDSLDIQINRKSTKIIKDHSKRSLSTIVRCRILFSRQSSNDFEKYIFSNRIWQRRKLYFFFAKLKKKQQIIHWVYKKGTKIQLVSSKNEPNRSKDSLIVPFSKRHKKCILWEVL